MHITWAQLFTSITGEKRNKEISQSIYSFLCVIEYKSLLFPLYMSLNFTSYVQFAHVILMRKHKAKEN